MEADVEDFVLFGSDPVHHLVLKTEGESCERSVGLRISFNQSVQPGKLGPAS